MSCLLLLVALLLPQSGMSAIASFASTSATCGAAMHACCRNMRAGHSLHTAPATCECTAQPALPEQQTVDPSRMAAGTTLQLPEAAAVLAPFAVTHARAFPPLRFPAARPPVPIRV